MWFILFHHSLKEFDRRSLKHFITATLAAEFHSILFSKATNCLGNFGNYFGLSSSVKDCDVHNGIPCQVRGEEVRGEDGSVCPDCIYSFILNVEADRTQSTVREEQYKYVVQHCLHAVLNMVSSVVVLFAMSSIKCLKKIIIITTVASDIF